MGDQRMAEIRTSDGSLYVYTHWCGRDLPKMALDAVMRAKPRLGDEAYWTRIVIDELTKSARDEETGFGIMLKPSCEDSYNDDKPSVLLDSTTGKAAVVNGEAIVEIASEDDIPNELEAEDEH